MVPVFTVDGVAYNVRIPRGGIKRSGKVLDGENAERTKSGRMVRDIIGTYYNYSIQLVTADIDPVAYDALYEVLTAPVDSHVITVPYGQGTITFDAYVANVDDVLLNRGKTRNLWGEMTFNFVAMAPRRR